MKVPIRNTRLRAFHTDEWYQIDRLLQQGTSGIFSRLAN